MGTCCSFTDKQRPVYQRRQGVNLSRNYFEQCQVAVYDAANFPVARFAFEQFDSISLKNTARRFSHDWYIANQRKTQKHEKDSVQCWIEQQWYHTSAKLRSQKIFCVENPVTTNSQWGQ